MRKLMSVVFGLGVLAFLLAGCEGMKMSMHESHATYADIDVPISKLPQAIKNAAPKAGFVVNQVQDTPVDGRFESSEVLVTYKKIDDKKTKIYVGVGTFFPDRDKEVLFLNEIKKELGVK
ncbi:MAG: hypothetical protein WCS96_05165 [Victivallales bacterium]